MICSLFFPVFSTIDEEKLVNFIHESIDIASYEYQHTDKSEIMQHCFGYMEAMNQILHLISKNNIDEKIP